MSDEVFVTTSLTGKIFINLGKFGIVTPGNSIKVSKAEFLATPGIPGMIKNGKLVIVEPAAPVEAPEAPKAPVEPPQAPEPIEEAPKTEKKAKKVRGLQTDAVVPEETPAEPESEEPKE